jgi:hypothetical protein
MDGRVTSAGEELVARQITHLCRAAEETPVRVSKIDEPKVMREVPHGGNRRFLAPIRQPCRRELDVDCDNYVHEIAQFISYGLYGMRNPSSKTTDYDF